MECKEKEQILQFAPFQSAVDECFWHRLSSLMLNKLGIDELLIPVICIDFLILIKLVLLFDCVEFSQID